MPVRFILTEGTAADSAQAIDLIDGIDMSYLFGDKAYDFNASVDYAIRNRIHLVIPSKRNRVHPRKRDYDEYLHEFRHLIENAFLHLKSWRGIATRYAKNIASFTAAVQIRIPSLWAKLL